MLLVKRPLETLRAMLIGVDRSIEARTSAAFAGDSGLIGLAERTIIATVTPAASFLDFEDVDADRRGRDDAASFVRGLQQALSHQGSRIEGLVLHGEPAAALLALAQQETADLIIVGARGRTRMQRLLLGSVSQKVMMHAACAVLTVRSPGWRNKKNHLENTPIF